MDNNRTTTAPLLVLPFLVAALITYPQPRDLQQRNENHDLILTIISVYNDQGGLIADLNKSVFTIYDNKEAQDVSYFNNEDQPISIGIVVDGTTPREEIRGVRTLNVIAEALTSFFDKSNKLNQYFLVGFNKGPQLLADWTSDSKLITEQLLSSKQSTPIDLHDACLLAFDKLTTSRYKKRVLLIIPNPEHMPDVSDLKDFKNALRQSDVLVYFVFSRTGGNFPMLASQGYGELAKMTGGLMFDPIGQSIKLMRLYVEQIAVELRHQYTIGFVPKAPADGKYHRISVRVTSSAAAASQLRHLKTRSREGYLAN